MTSSTNLIDSSPPTGQAGIEASGSADAEGRDRDANAALTIFGTLWAIGALFHQAAYPGSAFGLSSLLVLVPALILLQRPQSLLRLMVVVVCQLVQVARHGPANVSNHWVFASIVNLTILLALVAVWSRREKDIRAALFLTFAPVVRIELAILYFYATLHKVNTDFLNASVSCATTQYAQIASLYSFLPTGRWVELAVMYGTLCIEMAIPLLLIIRRTRVVGLTVAVFFHFLLALNPRFVFFDFSSILFACFFLFVPFDYWNALRTREFSSVAGRWVRSQVGHGRAVRLARALAGLLVLVLVLTYLFRLTPASVEAENLMQELARAAFVFYGLGLLVFLVKGLRTGVLLQRVKGLDTLTIKPAWLVVGPLLVLLNGASPYLGLKTESSFAMFSNLRTEIESNHLLVPNSMKLFDYQEDLVTIERSSAPEFQELAERNVILTWFDFRTRAMRAGDASVTYVRNGQRFDVPKISEDAAMTPPNWFARRMLRFRSVTLPDVAVRCRH